MKMPTAEPPAGDPIARRGWHDSIFNIRCVRWDMPVIKNNCQIWFWWSALLHHGLQGASIVVGMAMSEDYTVYQFGGLPPDAGIYPLNPQQFPTD